MRSTPCVRPYACLPNNPIYMYMYMYIQGYLRHIPSNCVLQQWLCTSHNHNYHTQSAQLAIESCPPRLSLE